jgi:hypothetical protein
LGIKPECNVLGMHLPGSLLLYKGRDANHTPADWALRHTQLAFCVSVAVLLEVPCLQHCCHCQAACLRLYSTQQP